MKTFMIVCLALVACACARPEEQYTDKYDNINVEEIVTNGRLLGPYVKCMLDEGKCSPEAKELKGHVRDAMETGCEKCTEVQKTKTRQVIKHLVNNEPEIWEKLTQKYDPDRKYTVKYEAELKTVKA